MDFSKQFTNMNNIYTIEKIEPITYDLDENSSKVNIVYEYLLHLLTKNGTRIAVSWIPFTVEGNSPKLKPGDKIIADSLEINSIWIRDEYNEKFPKYNIRRISEDRFSLNNDNIDFRCNSFFEVRNNKWKVIETIDELDFEANISFGKIEGLKKVN